MTSPTFGLVFNRDSTDARPAQPSDLSVIGLVLPADDADAQAFPLNEPVAFDSGDAAILGKLGDSELAYAVAGVDDQLADLQTSARVVAVRVAKGATDAETIANIIGSRTAASAAGHVGTGLYALLRAGSQVAVIPRLIGAPGYTGITTEQDGVMQANPICAALPSICNALLAHAVVAGPGEGQQAAQNWFETLPSGRLIAMDCPVRVAAGTGSRIEDGAARALGIGARVDFEHGGYPFHSFANRQVNGIIGLKTYYPFSWVDGATTGQELLANHIGVIERGELGVETAAASNGFVFMGLHSTETDPTWWFYNKTRARDWTHLALIKSVRLRMGVHNVNPHSVQAVLNDMAVINQEALMNGGSVGFHVGFEASKNNPSNLRQGKFRVFFAQEEPAPITQITIDSRPFYKALEVELATLIAQAATLVPQYAA